MEVSAGLVKQLRDKTGAAIMECKKALLETGADLEKAVEYLRRRGLAQARLKEGRPASEGKVAAYIHFGGKIGVLLELNSETDFVANTSEFETLARELAMHVAAANPLYLKRENIPAEVLDREREFYRAQALGAGKPAEIAEKIAEGKLADYLSQVCLLEQPFIKDQGITVKELVAQLAAKVGENVTIRRFARYRVGEDMGGAGQGENAG